MELRVYKIVEYTKVEGPGVRFCIWVQGCSRRCEGCGAKETWAHDSGELIDINLIFEKIKKQKNIEGVTFLGGEPFEQAKVLASLAQKIKKINLSLLVFTGNKYEDLLAKKDKDINKLLKYTDILVDGEFDKNQFDLSRPWVGSLNQKYLFLTQRYSMEDIKGIKNKVEMRLSKNGSIFINGMGDFEKINQNLVDSV